MEESRGDNLMVLPCILRIEGFHVGTFRSKIPQACQNHLPLIRFSTQCETSRRNGVAAGRFRKAPVRHAPRRRGYIARRAKQCDNECPALAFTSVGKIRLHCGTKTTGGGLTALNQPPSKRTGCCQNRGAVVPFTLLVRMA